MAERRFSPTRFLKSPRLIVGEVGSLALCGVLMTLIPQQGANASPDPTTGVVFRLVNVLGLDRITRTGWFLGLIALCAASLLVVLAGQAKRARADWTRLPAPESFRNAPLRQEFIRTSIPDGGSVATTVRLRGRIGLLGSPLFHLGLVVIAVAGIVRMAFGADAQVDLYEGELLPAGSSEWGAQWPGVLASDFSLAEPLTLEDVRPGSYPSGALQTLGATLVFGSGPAARRAAVAVNTSVSVPEGWIFATSLHGPAGLVTVSAPGRQAGGHAVLLNFEKGTWTGTLKLPDGSEVRMKSRDEGKLPTALELRTFRTGVLAWVGTLRPGESAEIVPGTVLTLVDIRWWLRLGGTRDPSVGIAYAGFAFVAIGTILMFAVVPVAEAVLVERTAEGEHVTVALRPRRFAPLYAERLATLARREGATTG